MVGLTAWSALCVAGWGDVAAAAVGGGVEGGDSVIGAGGAAVTTGSCAAPEATFT